MNPYTSSVKELALIYHEAKEKGDEALANNVADQYNCFREAEEAWARMANRIYSVTTEAIVKVNKNRFGLR